MTEELKSAISDSLPEDVKPDSSQADVTDSSPETQGQAEEPAHEETPSPKVEQKEPPFHEHPRWKERQRELDALRNDNQRLTALLEKIVEQNKQSTTPQADPYANMTAEERIFMESLDKRTRQIVEESIRVAQAPIMQKVEEARQTQAAMMYERFKQDNPDVIPGSPEEIAIADKFKKGYSLEDATELVMGPIRRQKDKEAATVHRKKAQEEKNKQKLAATQETSNLSPESPIDDKKLSVRERIAKIVDGHMASG